MKHIPENVVVGEGNDPDLDSEDENCAFDFNEI